VTGAFAMEVPKLRLYAQKGPFMQMGVGEG